jgi:hypothetical protein
VVSPILALQNELSLLTQTISSVSLENIN